MLADLLSHCVKLVLQRNGRNKVSRPDNPRQITRLRLEALESRAMLATLPAGFVEAPVAAGLSRATAMEFSPSGDLWVLEQGGAVKRFRPGSTTADVVGNVSGLGLDSQGERGLL